MSACTNLNITQQNASQQLFTWKCSWGHVDHFEVQPYYARFENLTWIAGSVSNVPLSSRSGGVYQYVYTTPGLDKADIAKFYVRAVATNASGGDPYWTDWWAESPFWLPTPQYTAAAEEWQKKPTSTPTCAAEFASDGRSIRVTATDAATKTAFLYVERSVDGGAWSTVKEYSREINVHTNATGWNKTFTDSSTSLGHSYRYRSRARNDLDGGGIYGDYSNPTSALVEAPSAGRNLAARLSGTDAVYLSWQNTGSTGDSIEIEYTSYPGDPWKDNIQSEIEKVTYNTSVENATVTQLDTGKTWKFRVYRKNSKGRTAAYLADGKNITASVAVPVPPAPTLNKISSLTATVVNGNMVKLKWYTVQESGASYKVEHSLYGDAWANNAAGVIDTEDTDGQGDGATGNYHVYTWADLERGRAHYFRVRKVKGDSQASSSIASISISASSSSLQAPTNLAAQITNGNVLLTWSATALSSSEKFVVEYTSNELAFQDNALGDIKNLEVDSSIVPANRVTVTDAESGLRWLFRVRRVGDDAVSAWSSTVSVDVPPDTESVESISAPTTSDTMAAYDVDATVIMGWVHNSASGSPQTAYQLVIRKMGANGWQTLATLEGGADSVVSVDLGGYNLEGGSLLDWKVRTQGVYQGYWSAWSRVQQFAAYAQPTAGVSVLYDGSEVGDGGQLVGMPLTIEVVAASQTSAVAPANVPIECAASIAPYEGFEGAGPDGTARYYPAGVPVWHGTFGTSEHYSDSTWDIPVTAADCRLVPGVEYEVRATVLTSQGMLAEAVPTYFVPGWDDSVPPPLATLRFYADDLYATIQPRCETSDGSQEQNDDPILAEGVVLYVYRVGVDGSTELVEGGVDNDGQHVCIDYHASLRSATYRIVAVDESTGAQAFTDMAIETPFYGAVVQWGEEWATSGDLMEERGPVAYAGARLVVAHNLEWDERHSPSLEHKLYQGNADPVARFGTGRGQSAKVSGALFREIERDTLESLWQLAAYKGAVYLRLPNGIGYYATAVPNIHGGGKSEVVTFDVEFVRVREA